MFDHLLDLLFINAGEPLDKFVECGAADKLLIHHGQRISRTRREHSRTDDVLR